MNLAIRMLAWAVALALVVLPLVAVLNGWLATERWPVQRLRLTAEYQRVSAEQVRTAVAPHLGRGFFAVDPAQVQRAILQIPWVDDAEVRKRWPDLLEVSVREHRVHARWGADRLLSDQGELFSAPGAEQLQGLPHLEGPDARVGEVIAMHALVQRLLTGSDMVVGGVRLSARGSWSLTLSDGARIVIGRDDPTPRLERLVRALPRLRAIDPRGFEQLDLRYTNGFAVRWRDPADAAVPASAPQATPASQQAGT